MLNGRTKGAFGAKRADSGHSAPLAYVSARIAGREVPAERDAVGGLGLRHLENAAQPRDRTAKPKCFISAVVVECRNLPTELEFQRIHQPRLSAQVFKKTLPLPPSFNHATPLSHVVTVRTLVRRNYVPLTAVSPPGASPGDPSVVSVLHPTNRRQLIERSEQGPPST